MINYQGEQGFTLLELLVVVTILGMLAAVGMGQYQTSQMKARDSQRKADLSNIARALEMYYNDHGEYPTNNDSGSIQIDNDGTTVYLSWGSSFETSDAVYMKVLPRDPEATATNDPNWDYCYMSDGGDDFMIFARLENENDDEYQEYYDTVCGDNYTYVITSSNTARPTVTP